MRIAGLLLFGVLCVGSCAAAQTYPAHVIVRRKLPSDLQASLEERISQFVAAQATDHWDEVTELLGRCRRACNDDKFYTSYTSSYKGCMMKRMREARLLDFDFSIEDLSISAPYEQMDPISGTVDRFTAEQSSWYLIGTGRFQTSSESWLEQTRIIAYRDQGQWYFIPAQRDMQRKWEKVHYTDTDFARDRKDEIEVQNNPTVPVEITDVHAYMNREYPEIRNMRFALRNKTSKKIDALIVDIRDETDPGEESLGEGPIEPKGQITEQDADFQAYHDFCEGMVKPALFIEEVDFADGSKWELKKSAKSEP